MMLLNETIKPTPMYVPFRGNGIFRYGPTGTLSDEFTGILRHQSCTKLVLAFGVSPVQNNSRRPHYRG